MTNACLTSSNGFIKVEGQIAPANPGPDATGNSSNGDKASSLLFGGTEEGGSIIKTRHQHLFRMHEMRSRGRVQPSVKDGGMAGARDGREGKPKKATWEVMTSQWLS